MSLREKAKEFILNYQRENGLQLSDFGRKKFMEAFYAGAEAWRDESENGSLVADLNAEINKFNHEDRP